MVDRFKRSDPPSILVSPSMVTGYDFPYDDARYQVIGKIAFPDGRSEVMKARHAKDPEYGYYLAMQSLIQACGRGMRAPDDTCDCFITDDHFSWFMGKCRKMAPKWFLDAVRTTRTIPRRVE